MGDKILIIDDDINILELFKMYLYEEGFIPIVAIDAANGLKCLEEKPALIVLDVNMPGVNGVDFCRKIRPFVQCPIIFLTGCVSQQEKILGLEAGGDDYLLKPFDMEELVMRIKAHLRRENRLHSKNEFKITKNLIVDFSQKKIYYDNNEIILSNKEFQIVELLVRNSGLVIDQETIYERIWGFNSEGDCKVVKEHIRRIRNKFHEHKVEDLIETVWGVGYRWKKS